MTPSIQTQSPDGPILDVKIYSTPVLDIHGAANGAALSLVWYCDFCGLETGGEFVAAYPTLTLAARARALAVAPTARAA